MQKIAIIGAGRVGQVIARDLSDDKTFEVTVADNRGEHLERLSAKMKVQTVRADASRPGVIQALVAKSDIVVGALPGALGFFALKEVLAAKKTYVDISFMAEDPRRLHEEAKSQGVSMLYDFGVAPGMSNLTAALEARRVAPARRIRISVGGLPRVRTLPWEYEAPFSPSDVLAEYIRPARVRVAGRTVEMPALDDNILVNLPQIGTMESFLTDGLRSLLDTLDCPNMEERTLRYPGYRERIRLLADTGFFSTDPVSVNGVSVVPLDLTRKLLDIAWQAPRDSSEFTIMRIAVEGMSGNRPVERVVHVFDETDKARNETSMARTTGFPAAIAVRGIARGILKLGPGIHPPESVVENEAFIRFLFEELAKRNVRYETLEDRILP